MISWPDSIPPWPESIPPWPESIPRFLRYTFWPRNPGQKVYLIKWGIVSGQDFLARKYTLKNEVYFLAREVYFLAREVYFLARISWPESIPHFLRYSFWPGFPGQILYLPGQKVYLPGQNVYLVFWGILSGQDFLARKYTSLARKYTSLARKYTSFFEVYFLARKSWPETIPQKMRYTFWPGNPGQKVYLPG